MTVKQLRDSLQRLPDDMEILCPQPFDPEGPETWEKAFMQVVNGKLRIGSEDFVHG